MAWARHHRDPARGLARAATAASAWFERVNGLRPPGSRLRRLRQEYDLDRDPGEAFERLRHAVPWLAPPPRGRPIRPRATKQDRGGDVFGAVSDGPALRAALEEAGWAARAMAYADGRP